MHQTRPCKIEEHLQMVLHF